MRALGMRTKWLKHEWFWKVRWAYLLAFGIGFTVIPLAVIIPLFGTLNSDGKAGLIVGVSVGLVGFCGLNIIIELVSYAVRRVKLGRKVARYAEGGDP